VRQEKATTLTAGELQGLQNARQKTADSLAVHA
jgi:hypothetical protein